MYFIYLMFIIQFILHYDGLKPTSSTFMAETPAIPFRAAATRTDAIIIIPALHFYVLIIVKHYSSPFFRILCLLSIYDLSEIQDVVMSLVSKKPLNSDRI